MRWRVARRSAAAPCRSICRSDPRRAATASTSGTCLRAAGRHAAQGLRLLTGKAWWRETAAIVLFHGGGWAMGEPAWAFSRAQHFAERGMVAIAAQYRLSDQKAITPHEAMADARAVIRWVRAHADSLGIDPKRVAAYGWSAGGHLAAVRGDIRQGRFRGTASPQGLTRSSSSLLQSHWRTMAGCSVS